MLAQRGAPTRRPQAAPPVAVGGSLLEAALAAVGSVELEAHRSPGLMAAKRAYEGLADGKVGWRSVIGVVGLAFPLAAVTKSGGATHPPQMSILLG